jgi:hypothetical protein
MRASALVVTSLAPNMLAVPFKEYAMGLIVSRSPKATIAEICAAYCS